MKTLLILTLLSSTYTILAQSKLYLGGYTGIGGLYTKVDYDNSSHNKLKSRLGLTGLFEVDFRYRFHQNLFLEAGITQILRTFRVDYDDGFIAFQNKGGKKGYKNGNNITAIPIGLLFRTPLSKSRDVFLTYKAGCMISDEPMSSLRGSNGFPYQKDSETFLELVRFSDRFLTNYSVYLNSGIALNYTPKQLSTWHVELNFALGLAKILEGELRYFNALNSDESIEDQVLTEPPSEQYTFYSRGSFFLLKIGYFIKYEELIKNRKLEKGSE